MSLRKRRTYFYVFLALFVIVIPLISFYMSGYRIGKGFRIVETGGVYIYSPESGAEIYIDDRSEKKLGAFQHDYFVQNLTPGTYTILVSKEGFWPWAKEVTIEEGRVGEAIAFLIPQDPEGEVVTPFLYPESATGTPSRPTPNKEYADLEVFFEDAMSARDASKTNDGALTATSSRGRVTLTGSHGQIKATWLGDMKSLPNYFCRGTVCEKDVIVFSAVAPIKAFDFYPGREDVILVAVQNGIYAIEIDARKHQNFQPVYKGVDPSFIVDGRTLYIKDADNFVKITL